MKDYKRMTVGEIVADNFNNAGIFDKYGIDFCLPWFRTASRSQ